MESHRNSLQPGYQLHWYVIKKILGQGGFGITYLALDTNLNQEVAIKEFLPVDMAVRENDASIHPVSGEYGAQFKWGLDRFMSEAQTLAKFKHPNIVRVLTVFPENNTAYMVMEYEHGRGMHELLKEKKTLNETDLKNILYPILNGLAQVHQEGFIHRDIKPPNIFIREDGSPVLLDFGSARQSFGEQTRTLTSMVSPGYAPFEQYVAKSAKQGPWTDIYGLSATLYRSVTGLSPADAMDRSEAILHTDRDVFVTASEIKPEGYSKAFLSAIDHGLAFKPDERPQSVLEWDKELKGEIIFDQSMIETVLDPAVQQLLNENKPDVATQKLATEEQLPVTKEKKKPSLFKRMARYTLILFAILFLLSLLEDKPEETPVADKAPLPEQPLDADIPKTASIDAQSEPEQNGLPLTEQESAFDPSTARLFEPEQQINELLTQAASDLDALRLTSPVGNNAFDKYQTILHLDPGNSDAEEGIYNIATEYLKISENSLEKGEVDKAIEYLNKAKRVRKDHNETGFVEQNIEDFITQEQEELARQQALTSEQHAKQETDKAISDKAPLLSREEIRRIKVLQYRLKNNPKNRQARQELQQVMKSFEEKVKYAIAENDFDTALAYVAEAKKISPRAVKLRQIEKQIEKKKKESLKDKYTAGTVFQDQLKNGDKGPGVVVIPHGSFQMGSQRRPREFFTGEFPVHKVKIEKTFAIMEKETTIDDFSRFIDSTDYKTEAEWQGGCGYWDKEWKVDPDRNWKNAGYAQSGNHPVVCVSWNDANAYAHWLIQQTGETYRLPTEAEWEYSARANHKGETYWGDKMDRKCQYENLMDFNEQDGRPFFECTDGYIYTAPVASFHPNSYGVYDMLGNVLELTMDCFNENYRHATKDGSAVIKGDCSNRMMRGGAWALPRGQSEERPTVSGRIPWAHDNRGFMIGFRLVREIE